MRRRQSALAALLLAMLVWMIALSVAPVAASASNVVVGGASALVYTAGSLVCHQRPERSFHYEGTQLPVCARCLGLYAGGLLGVAGWTIIAGLGRRARTPALGLTASSTVRTALVVAALPTAISVVTGLVGWWDPANTLRAILALPLGAAIGATVAAVTAGDLR